MTAQSHFPEIFQSILIKPITLRNLSELVDNRFYRNKIILWVLAFIPKYIHFFFKVNFVNLYHFVLRFLLDTENA